MVKHLSKLILPLLILLSFIFLLAYIIRLEDFTVTIIQTPSFLLPSLIFLFSGMFFQAYSWYKMLHKIYPKITFQPVLASSGITIFTKYIPGKIFTIISRSEYVSQKFSLNKTNTSNISFQTQIITILFGLGISFISYISQYWNSILITIIVLLILIWLFPFLLQLCNRIFSGFYKRDIQLSIFSFQDIIRLSPYFLANWFCWCIGFYFLILATGLHVDFRAAFTFALAAVGGILAIFSPGGIGVRETILVVALQQYGLDLNEATSLSVMSRIWFLLGEIFLFICGTFAANKVNKASVNTD